MTIVFRNDDTRWGLGTGAGVGGYVTSLQRDENDYEFKTRIETVEAGLAGLDVEVVYNGSSVTFNFSNGVTTTTSGPFPLPVAMINPVGEWLPNTHYNYLDLFSVRAQGIFIVLIEHTSAAVFDPDETDGSTDNLPLYQFLVQLRDVNYDIAFSIMGGIEGSTAREIIAQFVVPRALTMASGLNGAFAFLGVATSVEDLDLSIEKNGEEIGTILFEPGVGTQGTDGLGQFATITFAADVTFVAGDIIAIRGPTTADADAADLSITLPATRTDI